MEKLSVLLAHSEALFLINDIIAGESLDKQRQSLLELAASSRHHNHYLWLLTQSYSHSVYCVIKPPLKHHPLSFTKPTFKPAHYLSPPFWGILSYFRL